MRVMEGSVWSMGNRDLIGILQREAQRRSLRLRISGIDKGWFKKTVRFEVEGDESDVDAFSQALLGYFDR